MASYLDDSQWSARQNRLLRLRLIQPSNIMIHPLNPRMRQPLNILLLIKNYHISILPPQKYVVANTDPVYLQKQENRP